MWQNNKYDQAVRAVEKTMSQYGITRPLTVEYKDFWKNLPKTPKRREVEIVRRMSSSTILQSEHEVERKLQELYVYSDMGKSFESDAITHAVKKSLKVIEDEIPPPGKRLVTLKMLKNVHCNMENKKSKTLEVGKQIRKDLDKYSQVGEIKRKLYCMPDYIRNRERSVNVVKWPENKINSSTHRLNLNFNKVKGLNKKTRIGRVILRQEAKRKNMENLKQQLIHSSKK